LNGDLFTGKKLQQRSSGARANTIQLRLVFFFIFLESNEGQQRSSIG
jgi:hypothetical protein